MERPGIERLRGHLRRHNRQVFWLTIAALVMSAILWSGLYLLACWLYLLGGSAVRGTDFHWRSGGLLPGFVITVLVMCLFAWITRRMRPNRVPRDHRSIGEHFMDVVLAVPRLTLGVFGMSTAAARLKGEDLDHAWRLLRRMEEAGKPVSVQSLPVDITDGAMRDRILLALQLSGLIDIRPSASGPVLYFANERARLLAQERVQLRF
ncbi:MAG: hypothetical protein ABSE62_09205 [Chthoniobacteraceae bacterium]|jgi:hypothetical protein